MLAAVAVLVVVGAVTLGPAWLVADARRTVMAFVEALAAPWPGSVHRASVEVVANVLLFVPLGALAAMALTNHGPLLPLRLSAVSATAVGLVQTALPGRVPDIADISSSVIGTAVGSRSRAPVWLPRVISRGNGGRLRRRWTGPAVPGALLLIVGVTARSSGTAAPVVPTSSAPAIALGASPTVEDGYIANGEEPSPFGDVPALTRLDDALRTAIQDAARDAATDGVVLHVASGWRSEAYQQELFDEAVALYGSPDAARAHVLTPEESAHVTGDAVDVGPMDAMSWLAQHGSDYGLCQAYANEMWHFELTVEPGEPCPAPQADPSVR